jgi:sulfate adenylyltransferase subunit 1 (EFTu-like GTPase family)
LNAPLSRDHGSLLEERLQGAAAAAVGLVIVDARGGLEPGTRGYTGHLRRRGVRRLFVAVDNMDLVGNEYEVFKSVRAAFLAFAQPLGFVDIRFLPVSTRRGTNIVGKSTDIEWYDGPTLVDALASVG